MKKSKLKITNEELSEALSGLNMLILAQEAQKTSGNLTETGVAYLQGLKTAR